MTAMLPVQTDTSRPCPFCPGNEEGPAVLEIPDGDSRHWSVRVVENAFPAFEGNAAMVVNHRGPVFTEAPASGVHEVLILSPDHERTWAHLSDGQVSKVMVAIRDRMEAHSRTLGLRNTLAIVNSGREAGASIEHPHGQLLGMSFVPREMSEEQAGFGRFAGNCLLCTALEAEEDARHRLVDSNKDLVVTCPFWSGMPFEMLVIPRRHGAHLYQCSDEEVSAVGIAIRDMLLRLEQVVGLAPYNLVFHTAPYRATGPYHWHVHIWPKLTTKAGFEMGTGVMINVVPPEEAAQAMRMPVNAT